MTAYDRDFVAATVARMLWEVEAVAFRPDPPFVFTSGWASPVYIDCRRLISYPRLRRTLVELAERTILHEVGYEQIDVVAGGETAGIPFAAWLADRLMLPMQYVRKAPKGFGRNARIEGAVKEGWRTLLVEDLATDGRSKVGFVGALRDAGQTCEHAFVVFYYDVFPHARATIEKLGIALHYLCTWREVLAVARTEERFSPAVLGEVESFLSDPVGWSARHGGLDHVPD
ncbi:MAG: orotate phosphoribosyltransferase [Geminicoccaceae bacterium]|nr:orotate phosphoribosyltransferase [Geminicoccaceae bacterium]MCS7266892.1 orotate phosphoribosyltransferase [Geminicoccaceae bacterium]MCX7628843.1 orotate phosphoribosyltransferase [Geminicoccaceae bacterium]MDW8124184.1 orotate phosphoribosyltransferase [Geminicoccaceae bacterium]MDW8340593.1 orotate phosphoribosyltransferase [Geminicoccaceae bacterium]